MCSEKKSGRRFCFFFHTDSESEMDVDLLPQIQQRGLHIINKQAFLTIQPSPLKNRERIRAMAKGSTIKTMATPTRKYTKTILNHFLQGPIATERRGEYDRKKWGQEETQPDSKKRFPVYVTSSGRWSLQMPPPSLRRREPNIKFPVSAS